MWESLRRIFALTRKELLLIVKDRRTRNSLVIGPALQCILFGYAATYDLNDVPYAVLDEDHSIASHDFIAKLEGSRVFRRVAELRRSSDIRTVIDDEDAILVIHIPQNFSRNLLLGRTATVQIISDGRNSNTAGVAMSYIGASTDSFNADWQSSHGGGTAGIQPTMRAWYNPSLKTRWNMIPSLIGSITMMQTMMFAAMSIARERELGTFDQLLVTPFRPMEIMAGKAVPAMLMGLVMATNVLLVGVLWFRIPFQGSFLTLYVGLILFLFAAVGMGIFISSISNTMQQAMLYAMVMVMPFSMLSGLTTPISNMPEVFQYFTLINPLRYAITIGERVYLEGVGIDRLVPYLWPMALIAMVTLGGATWMFRHKVQ